VCGCLANLSVARNNKAALLVVLPLAIAALQTHASDASLCDNALNLIGNLAVLEANRVSVMEVVPTVTQALTTHSTVAGVTERALVCLTNLSVSEVNREALMGTLPQVMAALDAHATVVGVVRSGVQLLAYLSLVPANLSQLRKANVAPVVDRVTARYSSDAGINKWGPVLLGNLDGTPLPALTDSSPAALNSFLGTLRADAGNLSLQRRGVRALLALSGTAAHREPMMAAVDWLLATLDAHMGDPSLARDTLGTLSNLGSTGGKTEVRGAARAEAECCYRARPLTQ
jgi:hypothetical protein